MPRKLTVDSYAKIFYDLDKNDEYELLSEYKGSKKPVKVLHKVCGNIWDVQAGVITNKSRGPKCAYCGRKVAANNIHKAKASTKEDFIKYVKQETNDEYLVIGDYYNSKTPIEIKHVVCGNLYKVRPNDFKNGRRCPKCAISIRTNKRAKSTEEFRNQVNNLGNGDYVLESKYVNWKTKVKLLHKTCNNHYLVEPNSFIQGRRCPVCTSSYGETYVKDYLDKNNIYYEQQVKFSDLKDKRYLSFDFYLPSLDILIEYQGRQHYYPVERYGGYEHLTLQKKHDEMKYNYALDNQIELIEIDYTYNTYNKVSDFLDKII